MLELKLPPLRFTLPNWRPTDLEFLKEESARLRYSAKKAAGTSDAMKIRATEILRSVKAGRPLVSQINTGKDIRALFMLWINHNDKGQLFTGSFQPTQALFDRFQTVRPRLSKLGLYDLSQIYFKHFDRFPDLEMLCCYLQTQCKAQIFSGDKNPLALMATHREDIFRVEAPAKIVRFAVVHEKPLHNVFAEFGIPDMDGLFQEKCRLNYYVSRIEKLAPGEDSELFAEVLQKDVVSMPYRDGLLIGHAVLNILIAKVIKARVAMPENWMKIILTIAGDPRVPSSASSYQTWWQRLDQSYIDQVRGWLSRFDLDLFLRAFEAFANQSGDEDLRRMFPARKRFLEGLYEHGVVNNTRLFIGRHAIRYLKGNFEDNELPVFAELKHKDKSIIYLDIAGHHVIEGSHSAKFWVFDCLPKATRILNYNSTVFEQGELGGDIERSYIQEFGRPLERQGIPIGIVHHPNITWQRKAIKALEALGVRLDVEKLLTPEDYRIYKQKYGLKYY